MSKNLIDNQKGCINSNKTVNKSGLALDKEYKAALPSLSAVDTEIKIPKNCDFTKQNSSNFVKALIQIMYERGEINRATYEKAMKKLAREVKSA